VMLLTLFICWPFHFLVPVFVGYLAASAADALGSSPTITFHYAVVVFLVVAGVTYATNQEIV